MPLRQRCWPPVLRRLPTAESQQPRLQLAGTGPAGAASPSHGSRSRLWGGRQKGELCAQAQRPCVGGAVPSTVTGTTHTHNTVAWNKHSAHPSTTRPRLHMLAWQRRTRMKGRSPFPRVLQASSSPVAKKVKGRRSHLLSEPPGSRASAPPAAWTAGAAPSHTPTDPRQYVSNTHRSTSVPRCTQPHPQIHVTALSNAPSSTSVPRCGP